jgi:26S proteasome regulatory subunit N5
MDGSIPKRCSFSSIESIWQRTAGHAKSFQQGYQPREVTCLQVSDYLNASLHFFCYVSKMIKLIPLFICRTTVQLLLKKEIVNYPLPHQAELESLPAFLEGGEELTSFWHESFHRRIIQHNVRIISIYYKRIRGSRLAQLLQLDPSRLESEISGMVSDGSVYAKIDRPKDIVRFLAPKTPESILSDWAGDVDKLLHLVETTTHLIHKEHMTS